MEDERKNDDWSNFHIFTKWKNCKYMQVFLKFNRTYALY